MIDRPGRQLLESLLPARRCGRPALAREAALAAAAIDETAAADHYLDAVCAVIAAGEPRAASRLLDQCAAAAPDEPHWKGRLAGLAALIWARERNFYPGGVAAEIASSDSPPLGTPTPDDPETYLIEVLADYGGRITSALDQIEWHVRQNPDRLPPLLGTVWQAVQSLAPAVQRVEGEAHALSVFLSFADALRRSGQIEGALDVLAQIRGHYAKLAAAGIADATGLAVTYLAEGDWFAAPGSTPEALGFDLPGLAIPSPFRELRDLGRAEAAYEYAAGILGDVDQPGLHGALTLRRAAIAGERDDRDTQRSLLDQAATLFADAGDSAGRWVAVAHRLLAGLAAGEVATTRRAAGMRFDLEPRGEIADLKHWAESDGSVSFASGIGRLFQRAAQLWRASGDNHRAIAAYEMAVPLVPLNGAEAAGVVLLDLAAPEAASGLARRAATRSRFAVASLPAVVDAADKPLEWMRLVNAILGFANAQTNSAATAAGTDVRALDWALARARAMLATEGLPPPGASKGADVATLLAEDAARSLEEIAARANGATTEHDLRVLAITVDNARAMLAFSEAFASLQRGRMAAGAGAIETSERWFADALEKVRALPPEYAPFEVMVLVARDRLDEARTCLKTIDRSTVDLALLATAAVRCRDYELALELFRDSEPTTWVDLVDHAEARLGVGQFDAAIELARRAVAAFEAGFAQIRRDIERVAAADDVKVASLYLIATRALLARADAATNASAHTSALAEAFTYSDRARALAVQPLLAEEPNPLVLDWARTSADWQVAQDRLYRAYVDDLGDTAVAARLRELTAVEEDVVAVEAELESAQRAGRVAARRKPPGLAVVQASLPREKVLLEYQLIGRDLLIWAVAAGAAEAVTQTAGSYDIARLTRAVQRACMSGGPGEEVDELAEFLLDPVAAAI